MEIFINSLNYMGEMQRKTSDIRISRDLKTILEKFGDKSDIARMILHGRIDKDILQENHINYIGVSINDPSKISYLTLDRILKIEQSPTDDYWTTSMRFAGKPGSIVSKLFKEGYHSAVEVEKFATLYKTFSNTADFEFKVVTGEDIKTYYYAENYEKQSGSLGNSCMKSRETQEFFKIYIDNPNISMLVMLNPSGKIIGRALLWTSDEYKVMDRVYTISDEEYQALFFKWAHDNGFLHKAFQNWSRTLHFADGKIGTPIIKRIDIKLENWKHSKYPYLDTFKWLDTNTGIISNYKPDHFTESSDYKLLISPCGSSERATYLAFDELDNEYIHNGELVQLVNEDGVSINTHGRNSVWSDVCNCHILIAESEYCEKLETYIYKNFSRNPKDKVQERIDLIERHRRTKIDCPIRAHYGI